MQEGEQDMSDDEQETTPDDNLEEFVVDVPVGNGERSMTLHELQEAVEDESHPRHAEAVQRSKELAEQLKPAMERLRQTVLAQTGMRASLARTQETVARAATFSAARVDIPKFDMPKVDMASPVIEQNQRWQHSLREQQEELERAINAGVKAKTERRRLEDQRAEQTLDVLASMDAHLAHLNARIESVDARIEAGNSSSSKVAGWTILVAVLTLLATVAGIVVTVLLSR